jgi:uncharacterized repeat protein (TIGR01451 family)
MMAAKWKGSLSWLLWTGVFLVGLVVAVMLGSGLGVSQAALPPADVAMGKAINVPSVVPGQLPAPLYTITFTNPNPTQVILDRITDTLPSGFEFIDMAPFPISDWTIGPTDDVEPEIVWTGPITIPADGKLSLVYSVYVWGTVLPSTTPYVNTAAAVTDGGTHLGPVSARLLVGEADLSVDKQASPTQVVSGELVTYTVVFSNSGELTGTLELITDTLAPSLTFEGMAAGSEVISGPLVMTNTNTLVWDDPRQVPPQETLTLRYKARTSTAPGWSWPSNRVEADVGEKIITSTTTIRVGPEKAYFYFPICFKNFEYARLAVTKTASPTTVTTEPDQVVIYTVTIKNEGDTTGILKTVYDTLPFGFTFSAMANGSDVTGPPDKTTGKITWSGSWDMPPGSQKRVIYRVIPSQTPGQYTNAANVTAQEAFVPAQPASAVVDVKPPTLLQDDFNTGIGQWTPFLNYKPRLEEGQWRWGETDGVGDSGALTQDAKVSDNKVAHDALMMYLGEGAEQWTDYRVETKFLLRGGVNDDGSYNPAGGVPLGLWVRGQYEPSEIRAQWVTGYYIVVGGKLGGKNHYVRLAQLQTATDCWDAACNNPENLYNFNNSHTLLEVSQPGEFTRYAWHTLVVEVRGARIQVWMDGQQAIDFMDPKEPFLTGTVGFKTYKSMTASFDDIVVTPLNP